MTQMQKKIIDARNYVELKTRNKSSHNLLILNNHLKEDILSNLMT